MILKHHLIINRINISSNIVKSCFTFALINNFTRVGHEISKTKKVTEF